MDSWRRRAFILGSSSSGASVAAAAAAAGWILTGSLATVAATGDMDDAVAEDLEFGAAAAVALVGVGGSGAAIGVIAFLGAIMGRVGREERHFGGA